MDCFFRVYYYNVNLLIIDFIGAQSTGPGIKNVLFMLGNSRIRLKTNVDTHRNNTKLLIASGRLELGDNIYGLYRSIFNHCDVFGQQRN